MATKCDVVTVLRSKRNKCFWHLRAANGEILACSEEYSSKRACLETVRGLLRRNPTLVFGVLE